MLDGNASFEVDHSTTGPFVVSTGPFTARVLGTAFLIRHTAGDSHIHVAVGEGKVRVTAPTLRRSGVTLTAGTVGDITDSTVYVRQLEENTQSTEWRRGQLVFHHASVAAVLRTLSQWYGYQFRCADSMLAQQDVTIGISTRSSSSAFATLKSVLSVNVTVVGDTVTLTPQTLQRSKGTPRVRSYDVWIPKREVGR
jgi:transmembrane sensor